MKQIALFLFAFICLIPLTSQEKTLPDISGKWTGSLLIQNSKLKLVFNFTRHENAVSVTIDSPDQGAKGIPAKDVIFRNDSVIVDVPVIMGQYKAVLTTKTSMTGMWYQNGMSIPLNIDKSSGMEVLQLIPPNPLYNSKEVKIVNQKTGVTLAGTLTTPKDAKNCPAVILVSGSGPQNRDEELMGQKPFYRIANYLSERGIAVLRYDDRGVNESTGNFQTATSFDFADDAESAFAFMRKQPGINPEKVGIIGHSEGAMIAPIVASRNKEVAFIILLAGPGITGREILITQTEAMLLGQGFVKDSAMKISNLNKEIMDIVENNQNDKDAKNLIKQKIEKMNFPEKEKEDYTRSFSIYLTPWFRTFIAFDPALYLSKVNCAVLALNGSKDLQVLPKQNLAGIEKALKKGQNANYEIHELRGYNHLFQESQTGMPAEYRNTQKPVMDNKVLEITEEWIKKYFHSEGK